MSNPHIRLHPQAHRNIPLTSLRKFPLMPCWLRSAPTGGRYTCSVPPPRVYKRQRVRVAAGTHPNLSVCEVALGDSVFYATVTAEPGADGTLAVATGTGMQIDPPGINAPGIGRPSALPAVVSPVPSTPSSAQLLALMQTLDPQMLQQLLTHAGLAGAGPGLPSPVPAVQPLPPSVSAAVITGQDALSEGGSAPAPAPTAPPP